MSDTFCNDAAHFEWRQLCQAAFLELDPIELLERIAAARSAILERIQDNFPKPNNTEQYALREALETLGTLGELAERDIGLSKKIVEPEESNSSKLGQDYGTSQSPTVKSWLIQEQRGEVRWISRPNTIGKNSTRLHCSKPTGASRCPGCPMSESAAIEPAQFFHLTLRSSASAGPLPPKMFFLFLYLFRSRSRYLSGLAARCARLPHLLEQ